VKRRCFFRGLPGAGPCDGRLVRVHLIPRQLLKRELNAAPKVQTDPRGWVWGCGGPKGLAMGHTDTEEEAWKQARAALRTLGVVPMGQG
jgi:hypothetical protein